MQFFKKLLFTLILVPSALFFCLIFAAADFFLSFARNLKEEFTDIGNYWEGDHNGF